MNETVKNDGGPAFPRADSISPDGTFWEAGNDGMTLRDYCAIHADLSKMEFNSLPALVEFLGEELPSEVDDTHLIGMGARANAKLRYLIADAMLVERKK